MGYELSADELKRAVSWNMLDDGSRRAFYSLPSESLPSESLPSESLPSEASRGVASLLIVPGLGEHGGRYAACARVFSQSGFDVHAIDLIGHGLSPGKRGCIESYDGLMDEIEVAMEAMARKNPQIPSVLWGHSMGGNLVLNYLLRKNRLPHCAISSGPMLRSGKLPSKPLLWLARRLAIVLPNYQLRAPVNHADCTRDETQRAFMSSDQLFHKQLSLRLGAALIDSGQWALDHAEQLRTPVLLVHSEQDKITSAAASVEFAKMCAKFCELKLLPDQLHDVHRDLGSEAVLAFMCEWLHKKLQG
jgi:alpha-beta hydrolase superfamily lysophospholipase